MLLVESRDQTLRRMRRLSAALAFVTLALAGWSAWRDPALPPFLLACTAAGVVVGLMLLLDIRPRPRALGLSISAGGPPSRVRCPSGSGWRAV